MNWRHKALAFRVLGAMPFGRHLHRFAQRHLTARYFHRIDDHTIKTPFYHIDRLKLLEPRPVTVEFGAGRNLMTPLLMSNAGAGRVHAFDLARLATVEQVNAVIDKLRELVPGAWPAIGTFDDLTSFYRFDYHAPADARATSLPDDSVDLVYSTATNEHIPEDALRAILAEAHRLVKPQGRLSFIIDYHDHYASADPRITRYNFYQYDDRAWEAYNPGDHFQNRLRHADHERIFRELGFEILESERIIPPGAEAELDRVPLAPRFADYARDDLLAISGRFLLGPGKSA